MIILLGVPGSGKSTQGQMLADRGHLKWLSMGDICRRQASPDQLKRMLSGELLDDEETIGFLKMELKHIPDNPQLILDGFPRKSRQTDWLLEEHHSGRMHVSAVVNLYAEEAIVEKRLLSRGRHDDNRQTIANRFEIYEKSSRPVIDHMQQNGIPILTINADQIPEAILGDIVSGLDKLGIKA